MLFGVITRPVDLASVMPYVDGLEWRLDLYADRELIKQWPKKNLFTLRGGCKEELEKWLELSPDYCDIDAKEEWAEEIIQTYPHVRFILSYHNFEETPENLDEIFADMCRVPAYAYKIATHANSTLDALRMLTFVQGKQNVTGITMGEKGKASRIVGPIVGNFIDYASLEETNPWGQLTVKELCEVYRYHHLRKGDPIYALLGDPVEYSISHQTHNRVLTQGVYIKLQLRKGELEQFRDLSRQLPFKGFSITMPHKHEISSEGPVNTVMVDEDKWVGRNTDGSAAVQLIERYTTLKGKRCLIIGAGGVAHAFARVCKEKGATVLVANRTQEKAKQIADEIYELEDIPSDYDILLQATNVGMSPDENAMPISSHAIKPGCIVLEAISSPNETKLLQEARKRGCILITGKELFFAQAAEQFQFWSGSSSEKSPLNF